MASKTMTLTATRNIPLSMCIDKIPAHLAKHPGGARVEKGTEITVDEKRGRTLLAHNYAKK